MMKFKALVLGVLLVATLAVATPVLAGPQNGEVNHANGGQDCAGTLPDNFAEEVTLFLFTFVLEWLPVDVSCWFGDSCE